MARFNIHELLEKDMSRKEFIKYMIAGLLAVVGVTSILNNLSSLSSTQDHDKALSGYGVSPYGR